MSIRVYIYLNDKIDRYMPLTGWRKFLNRFLRIPFKRQIIGVQMNHDTLATHPDNLPRLREILTADGMEVIVKNPVMAVKK